MCQPSAKILHMFTLKIFIVLSQKTGYYFNDFSFHVNLKALLIMDSINAYFQSIQFCVFFRQILISFITMKIFTIKKKLAIKIKIVYHAYLHLFIIIILICLCIQYIMFFLIDLKYLCVRMTTTLTEN